MPTNLDTDKYTESGESNTSRCHHEKQSPKVTEDVTDSLVITKSDTDRSTESGESNTSRCHHEIQSPKVTEDVTDSLVITKSDTDRSTESGESNTSRCHHEIQSPKVTEDVTDSLVITKSDTDRSTESGESNTSRCHHEIQSPKDTEDVTDSLVITKSDTDRSTESGESNTSRCHHEIQSPKVTEDVTDSLVITKSDTDRSTESGESNTSRCHHEIQSPKVTEDVTDSLVITKSDTDRSTESGESNTSRCHHEIQSPKDTEDVTDSLVITKSDTDRSTESGESNTSRCHHEIQSPKDTEDVTDSLVITKSDTDRSTESGESNTSRCHHEIQSPKDTEDVTDSSVEELEEAYIKTMGNRKQELEIKNQCDDEAERMTDLENKPLQNINEMDELDQYEQAKERIGENSSCFYREDGKMFYLTIGMLHTLFEKVQIEKTDIELYPIRSLKYINVFETSKVTNMKKTFNLRKDNNCQNINMRARQIQHFVDNFSNRKRNFTVDLDNVINKIVNLIGTDILVAAELASMLQHTSLNHGGILFSTINVQAEMTSFDIKTVLLGYTNENQEMKSLLTIQTVLKSNKGVECVVYLIARYIRINGLFGFKKHCLTQVPVVNPALMMQKYHLQKMENTGQTYQQIMMENWILLFGSLFYTFISEEITESFQKTSLQIGKFSDTGMPLDTISCPVDTTQKKQDSSGHSGLLKYMVTFYLMHEVTKFFHDRGCFGNLPGSEKLNDDIGSPRKYMCNNNQTKNWKSTKYTRHKMELQKMVRHLTKCDNLPVGLSKECVQTVEDVVCLQKIKFDKRKQCYNMIKMIMIAYIHDEKLNPKHFNSKLNSYFFHIPWKEECLWDYYDSPYGYLFRVRKNSIPAVTLDVNMEHGAEIMDREVPGHSSTNGKSSQIPKPDETQTDIPPRKDEHAQNHNKTINKGQTNHGIKSHKTVLQIPKLNVGDDYLTNDIAINMGKTKISDHKQDQEQSDKDQYHPEFQDQCAGNQIVRPKCPQTYTTVDIHHAKKRGLPTKDVNKSNKLRLGPEMTNQNMQHKSSVIVSQKFDSKEISSSELFENGSKLKNISKVRSIDPRTQHSGTPNTSEIFGTGKKSGEWKHLLNKGTKKQNFVYPDPASSEMFGDGVNKYYHDIDSAEMFGDGVNKYYHDIDSAEMFGDGNKTKSPEQPVGSAISGRPGSGNNLHISTGNRSRDYRDSYNGAQQVLRIGTFMVDINNRDNYTGILCGTEGDLDKFFQNQIPNDGVITDENLQRVVSHIDSFPFKEDVDLYRRTCVRKIGLGYFEIDEELGKGSYGVAYLCTAKIPGSVKQFWFVLKEIELSRFDSSEGLVPLKHARDCPQVLKIYGAYKTAGYMNILMEYAEGGTLNEVIRDNVWDMTAKIMCIETLLKGLHYLHTQGIVVYDIKMLNIVLRKKDDPTSVAYIDWGSSKSDRHERPLNYKNGTPLFLPPEIDQISENYLRFDPCLKFVDMWGIGCVLYRMIKGENVWRDICSEVKDVPKQRKGNLIRRLIEGQRYNIYDNIDQMNQRGPDDVRLPSVLHLLSRLLDPCPESRILTDEALKHHVFSETRRCLIPMPVFDLLNDQIMFTPNDMKRLLDMKTVQRNDRFKVWVTVFYKDRVVAHVYVLKGMSGKDLYKMLEEKINGFFVPELKDSEYYFVLEKTDRFYKDCVVELKKLEEN